MKYKFLKSIENAVVRKSYHELANRNCIRKARVNGIDTAND